MADPTLYNEEEFCNCPASVAFCGVQLGGTDGAVSMDVKYEYKEVKCNQSQGNVIKKIVTKATMTVVAKFMQIDKALTLLLDENKKITGAVIGTDVLAGNGDDLVLSEIGGTRIHNCKRMKVIKDYKYDVDGENDHGIELTFEGSLDCTNADADELYAITSAAAPTG
ncbi:hypothetical protein AAEX28_02375 [Lentisphaerota bacterium WC36G]|nr:hypothetical protein LJT99_05260 [Lentisphaerae bacterium WC36]